MIILIIRFAHGTPYIAAASSISGESCNIEFIPALAANGRYFTAPASTRMRNEFAKNEKLVDMARYIAPKAIEGIKHGKNERPLTIPASLVPLFLTTA